MAFQGFIATSLGFIPSFVIMYYLLYKYDRFFDDRKVVALYGIGMVFGTIIALFYAIFTASAIMSAIDLSILVFVLALPLFTELGKQTILGHKRMRLKFDTVFYGGALGAGIGAMILVSRAFRIFYSPGIADLKLYKDPLVLLTLLMFSLAMCGIHIASGILIGIGSSSGDFWPYLLRALLLLMTFNLLLLPYLWQIEMGYVFLAAAMFYSLFVAWYTMSYLLPNSIPEDIMRKMRRERRRTRHSTNKEDKASDSD